MTKTLKTAALSAFAGLATLLAVSSTANAGGGVILEFGDGYDGPHGGAFFDEPGFPHGPKPHGPKPHHPRPRDFVGGGIIIGDIGHSKPRHIARCTVDQALDKARFEYGLRRVNVEFANKHVIGVTGKRKHKWREIVFARAPGCPVIDY